AAMDKNHVCRADPHLRNILAANSLASDDLAKGINRGLATCQGGIALEAVLAHLELDPKGSRRQAEVISFGVGRAKPPIRRFEHVAHARQTFARAKGRDDPVLRGLTRVETLGHSAKL